MRRIWQAIGSMRTTLALLLAVALLLLLNVILPQAHVDPEAVELAAQRSPLSRTVLVTWGLGDIPSSPIFLLVLALFFVNLGVVLVARSTSTFRRLRTPPPSTDKLRQMIAKHGPIALHRPPGDTLRVVHDTLQRLGYHCFTVDDEGIWALKNRTAILGFPLFHLSFFLFCAGGVLLYLTRFDAGIILSEGQRSTGAYDRILRRSLWMDPPVEEIALERLDPRVERGQPLQLEATLSIAGLDAGAPRVARINHPIKWADRTLLVERSGVAAVLWVQDLQGHTYDRVAVNIPTQGPVQPVPLAGGAMEVQIEPVPFGPEFPLRQQLSSTVIALSLLHEGQLRFEHRLRSGQVALHDDLVVKLEELRYWAGLRLIRERGGALLVAGFVIGVLGLLWRMVWTRRELVVLIEPAQILVAGRGELYPVSFAVELREIAALLEERLAAEASAREKGHASFGDSLE